MRWVIAIATAFLIAGKPNIADATDDPFAYQIVLTPDDGAVDPSITARLSTQLEHCRRSAGKADNPFVSGSSCLDAEFARQNHSLEKTLQLTLRRLPEARRSTLAGAQQLWTAARDPFCRRDADAMQSGDLAMTDYAYCRVELTIRRTLWLEKLR